MYNKLKEYEDLEEQGLLLKLPCNIGTIVYVIGTRCLAGEEPIKGCGCVPCEKCIYDKTYTIFEREVNNSLMYNLVMDSNDNYVLNKTVFLTKEEAEKALERLEKENERY